LEFGDYRGLSLALAREHEPGFNEAKPKNRPTKWNEAVLGFLYVAVERARISVGRKVNSKEIYSAVANQEPWNQFLETVNSIGVSSDPAEAIRRAYFKAKKNRAKRCGATIVNLKRKEPLKNLTTLHHCM
jgi:hypothetical protein